MACAPAGPTPYFGCCPNVARCCPFNFTSDPAYNGCTFAPWSLAFVRQTHHFSNQCPEGSIPTANGACRIPVAPFYVNAIEYFGIGSCCRNIWTDVLETSGCSHQGAPANCGSPSQASLISQVQALFDSAKVLLTPSSGFQQTYTKTYDSNGNIVNGLGGEFVYPAPPSSSYAGCQHPGATNNTFWAAFHSVSGAATYTKVYGQWAAIKWALDITYNATACQNFIYSILECQSGSAPTTGQFVRTEASPSEVSVWDVFVTDGCDETIGTYRTAVFWTLQKDAVCPNLAP